MQGNFHQSHHHRRQIPTPQPPPGQGALRQVPCDVCVCVRARARACSSVLEVSKAGLPLCVRPAPWLLLTSGCCLCPQTGSSRASTWLQPPWDLSCLEEALKVGLSATPAPSLRGQPPGFVSLHKGAEMRGDCSELQVRVLAGHSRAVLAPVKQGQ